MGDGSSHCVRHINVYRLGLTDCSGFITIRVGARGSSLYANWTPVYNLGNLTLALFLVSFIDDNNNNSNSNNSINTGSKSLIRNPWDQTLFVFRNLFDFRMEDF